MSGNIGEAIGVLDNEFEDGYDIITVGIKLSAVTTAFLDSDLIVGPLGESKIKKFKKKGVDLSHLFEELGNSEFGNSESGEIAGLFGKASGLVDNLLEWRHVVEYNYVNPRDLKKADAAREKLVEIMRQLQRKL